MKIKLLILCLTIVSLFSACGAPAANTTPTVANATRGGQLTYRLSTAPTTFNYLMAKDEATIDTAFYMLTSRLVDLDHSTQKYVPALAESWKREDDGVTVDVKLRDGLKFSDGSEITADDVAFTMAAIYDEKTNSPAWKGAMTIGDGKQIGVKVVSKQELKLVFPQKVAAVENYMINIGVLPAKVLKPSLDAGTLSEAWPLTSDPKTIVSSGPFVVESAAVGERLTFARNPNYWKKDASGTQLPYLDKIVFEVISDPNAALAKLEQGEVDIVDRIRPSDFASLGKPGSPIKAIDVGPGMGTDHMFFNLNKTDAAGKDLTALPRYAWFSDVRFRKAVSKAIDKKTIAETTLRGLATPMGSFVSPGNKAWLNKDISADTYDLAGAEKLLAEAGFIKKGTEQSPELYDAKGTRVEFTLLVAVENQPRNLTAAVIQEDLAKLGIKMQVAPIESKDLTARWSKSHDYDAILHGLSVSDMEPSTMAAFIESSGAIHQWAPMQKSPATEWEARLDKLFDEQAAETDAAKRKALFDEIQKIIADEMPVIPLVTRHVASAANIRVGNISPSPMLPYALWNVDELFVAK
ncbi:MAG: ABC transporter substrate-binding protein [Acidobacteria bacterium]|nr:ABC transporter substrate-binding protein [Acidobacteriota bacterium]